MAQGSLWRLVFTRPYVLQRHGIEQISVSEGNHEPMIKLQLAEVSVYLIREPAYDKSTRIQVRKKSIWDRLAQIRRNRASFPSPDPGPVTMSFECPALKGAHLKQVQRNSRSPVLGSVPM